MTVLRSRAEERPAGGGGLLGQRVALTTVFVALGFGAATFGARVPAVKASLHLSTGTLGASLLGGAIGLACAAPLTAVALRRWSTRPVIAVGLLLNAGGLALVVVATGAPSLFAVLAVWGFGSGLVDVAMNTEAAALQTRVGRPIMSRLHGGYSGGGLVGAALGALAASAGVGISVHFGAAAAALAAAGWVATSRLDGTGPTPPAARTGRRWRPGRPALPAVLVVLGIIAFGDFMAEGAANDWSAVYIHGSLGASTGYAALGYTAFSVAMAIGRVSGDHLTLAVGPVRLVRCAAVVAAAGMLLALLGGRPVLALVGFGLLGLGLSVVVPLAFSAAASVGQAGTSVAAVTTCGYLGLMVGPPLIGGIGQAVGLRTALGIVVVAAVGAAVMAGAVRPRAGSATGTVATPEPA